MAKPSHRRRRPARIASLMKAMAGLRGAVYYLGLPKMAG
jgi:hypothetical protein